MEKLFISAAYKYVAMALMLTEAHRAMVGLDVATWKPVTPSEVVAYHVTPPRLRPGGSVDTSTHLFGFGAEGKLQFIQTLEPEPGVSLDGRHGQWAKMKSLVDSNGAYALASNWLGKLDVDVVALQEKHPVRVTQEFYFAGGFELPPEGRKQVMLPRFEVKWGTNTSRPAVWVSIFGPTKEPIHIRQEDAAYSRRPRGIVKDAERLLKIADAEFAAMSHAQKSNLVAECSPASYPFIQLPTPVSNERRSLQPALNNSPRREKALRTIEPKPPAPAK